MATSKELVKRLRRNAIAIYLVAPESVAKEISAILTEAAEKVQELQNYVDDMEAAKTADPYNLIDGGFV